MSRLRPLFLTLALSTVALIAQPPPGYYDPAAGLTGPALRQALHDIIDNHTVLANSSLWAAFETTDDRIDGYVWDIYSDIPGGTAPYLYTFGTDQCGTYNSEADCYNREHSFPQSWFGSGPPMDTDLHHIYPTDAWVNQKRGNLPYGKVGVADFISMNGTKTGANIWPGYGGVVCEPINDFKGDLARSYFYMLTRYAPEAGGWTTDMLTAGNFTPWAEALLLQWHADDPVSTKEVDRNNAVYALQGNRNPYIDDPQWVASIWGPSASTPELVTTAARVWWSDDQLHIINASLGNCIAQLFDATGRTISSTEFDSGIGSMAVKAPNAVYVLLLSNAQGTSAIRTVRWIND